ncbi:MAG TPA: hypothetical protein VEX38_02105 [Fimbriimonadaceae bacterium]|nr:hypothetical protein [Fimbriimonadaceae bacterium]
MRFAGLAALLLIAGCASGGRPAEPGPSLVGRWLSGSSVTDYQTARFFESGQCVFMGNRANAIGQFKLSGPKLSILVSLPAAGGPGFVPSPGNETQIDLVVSVEGKTLRLADPSGRLLGQPGAELAFRQVDAPEHERVVSEITKARTVKTAE